MRRSPQGEAAMADDTYTAADERARAARRAGLQAKKDEQPSNTTRSYAAKQREWKARSFRPPSLIEERERER